ncbi:MAG: hypothetical protein KJ571_16000 [Bacteroidetes bacterium]|nr:hypothetical protein [Bacteroidota bacterium]
MKTQLFFILILSLFFIGCDTSTNSINDSSVFGIYLLKNDTLSTDKAKQFSLESLIVENEPIINIDDIISYEWSNHIVNLTPEAFEKFNAIEIKIKSTYGLPFIVMVNSQKIYLGNVYPGYSSYFHMDLPFINVAPFIEMRIGRAPDKNIVDKRTDQRIYSVLKNNNKIKI